MVTYFHHRCKSEKSSIKFNLRIVTTLYSDVHGNFMIDIRVYTKLNTILP